MHIFVEKTLGFILPKIFSPPTEDMLAFKQPQLSEASSTLNVSSLAFENNQHMPWKYGGEGVGEDTCPPLKVENIPEGTSKLVFILEDLDVPLPKPVVHTLAYNLPVQEEFPEGFFDPTESSDAVTCGKGVFGKTGYHGPRPLVNHGPHRYYFQFFAIKDGAPKLEPLLEKAAVLVYLQKWATAQGHLIGTFERTDAKH